ncbi:phospholipase D family protein [Pseudomonas aeruginosa]|uniref:phospholipase D family protein n=1 Tax=Pseudomonas aeruginosa TaxID=287 RepID=UPI000DF011AC|nr:phospholipase D family protein [Pseudomonas aeruginosa]MCO1763871.1 hypothetical protein [Pseudomonas aeruginosa]MCS7938897.1 phospholipase D family protein [Pseudomonas aeruginosa]MCV4037227.1 phospholipase D family protein [Pseudomonas aeruginosa]QYE69897.1 phospholipase D family protein [Pseudomonas aeruginosa]RCN12913.1 putative HKD family nuclease [Pseudomonas aeruginosa]
MKLITTARSLDAHLHRLITTHKNIALGVAWASASTKAYGCLLKYRENIRTAVIGIHFYQTDADVLDAFVDSTTVQFVLQPSGVFHPKLYLFWSDDRWEAIIGSANFTAGALGKNTELCTLISDGDGLDLAELQAVISGYGTHARTINSVDAQRYRSMREARRPELDKLKDQYGARPASKDALESRVMSLDWPAYLAAIQKDVQHGFAERLDLLDDIEDAFNSAPAFKDIDPQLRRAIAGLPNKLIATAAWFGSMHGAGVFKNLVIEHPEQLSRALDCIPRDGQVTKSQYQAYVKEFCKAFPNGRDGIATATRLLSMKRPDQFLCVDSANRKQLARDIGIVSAHQLDYDRYWGEVVERIMNAPWWNSPPPSSGSNLKAWSARAAMLDALFYKPKE